MRALSVTHALALRRLSVAGGALAASLLAHCAAMGDLALTPSAPVAWGAMLAIVTVVGARRRFRPRGPGRSLAAMGAAQAAVHAAMSYAPWAFGLAPHHHDAALVGPEALVAHGAAALVLAALTTRLEAWLARAVVLAALTTRLEAWLARAVAVVGAVRRWLAARPAPVAASEALPRPASRAPRRPLRGPVPSRGPPLLRAA